MKYFVGLFILFGVLFVSPLHAQDKKVTGVIQDEEGPVVNATISEKGNLKNAVVADMTGRFVIALKGTSNTIIIQAVGHETKELKVAAGQTLTVTLPKLTKDMDEVVVVGYAKQKKVTLTGSVSSIAGDEIRQNPSASLQNALTGKIPGFFSQQRSGQPGSDGAAFYIRGVSTTGNTAPIILVDDIEFSYSQFSRLDPNEIESISVLKDASSTAIYGIKGANGVVLVTTRRGRVGTPKISLRAEHSLQQPTIFPKYLNSYETAKLYNQAKVNDGAAPYFTDADLDAYKNHTDPYGHPDNDWRSILFKKFSQQSRGNLDVSGGTERVKYFISVGYLWQDGMLKNFGKQTDVNNSYYYRRYNYRSNLDVNVTKTTDLRLDLFGNVGESNSPYYSHPNGSDKDIFYEYSSFLSLAPYAYPIYNPDGSYGYSTKQPDRYNVGNIVTRLVNGGYNRSFDNNMNLNASLNQKLNFITQGLSFRTNISYASSHSYSRNMTRISYAFPQYIYDVATNTYTPKDANVYRITRYNMGYSAGSTRRVTNIQAILNYTRNFKKHHVTGLALFSQRSEIDPSVKSDYTPTRSRGFSGRVGYDYNLKYLLEFNGAYNGTDRFVGSKRYGFFPAVSVGWNIADEKFFRNNIKFIDRLKLRASYGIVGADQLPSGRSYSYLQTYSSGTGPSFGYTDNTQSYYSEGTLSNKEVTWEKEKKLDIGFDLDLLHKKLNIVADYFDHNRFDILTTRGTVSYVFGQSLPPVNLGKVNNKGGELEITYKDRAGSFNWYVKGNYSYAKNKYVFIDEPQAAYPWMQATGKSLGMIQVYKCIGFFRDSADIAKSPTQTGARPGDLKYADLNNDGKIDAYDMAYTGFPNLPNTNVGFGGGISYKNFSFSFLFQGAFNFNVRGVAESIQAFGSNMMSIHQQAWTPELGNNAKYPRLSLIPGVSEPRTYPSTFWFISGNYVRLRNAEIGYTFSDSFLQKLKLSEARAYINGNNLFSWSNIQKFYQFDPEITSGSDRTNYPPQRIINIGLTVTF